MVILAALFLLIGLSEGTSDDRVVPAEEVLASIKAGKAADFDGCTIEGDLDLGALKIEGPVHFNHTIFRDSVIFNYTTFNDTAYFRGSRFNEFAYFDESQFKCDAYFDSCRFDSTAYFSRSRFQWLALFTGTFFNGDSSFGSTFNGPTYFRFCSFNRSAKFSGSTSELFVSFYRSCFNGIAYFGGSDIVDGDIFVRYFGAEFDGADFRETRFNDTAYFDRCMFNYANFGDATFNSYADFRDSKFNIADFTATQFNKEAQFDDAKFAGKVSFNSSRFKGDALFENTAFESELSLTRARYDKLFIRWHNFKGGLAYDDAAYMSLMKNFKDLGYYEDYDGCYYQYRKAHRDQPWPSVSGWEASIRKVIDNPMELFYGYGTKPFNAFFFSLVIVLLFALFWWALGLGGPKDRTLANLPPGEEWLDDDITDILGFSVTVFLSGTRFFIDAPALPRIEGRSRSMIKKAFILERVLGALFSILFFIAISGTIVRAS